MVRIAEARVAHLFRLAAQESAGAPSDLPDRYVRLARRIGSRYNVRLGPEYRNLYCRGCSAYWVEGRTVRTRLRLGRTVRTCLRCGRIRRIYVRSTTPPGDFTVSDTGAAPGMPRGLVAPSEDESGREDATGPEDG